ncbi:MAG TPA: choice-of-anchor D domain-containing protein [Candidatus Kapabacteria bacterium]|nr:choice-of-anchor D domain-containing protein [Candidatus Kapabacteria bacterium]
MILKSTYRLMVLSAMLFAAVDGYGQACKKNMLTIPDGNSYAASTSPKNMPTGALTLECWAKDSLFVTGGGLIEFGDANDTGSFSLRFGSGQFLVATFRTNIGVVSATSSQLPNILQWHHFAVTFTPNDSIRFFVDGQFLNGAPTNASSLIGGWNSFFIGHSGTTAQSFIGSIDEARIWNIARNAIQINSLKALPLSGNENGLVSYYTFDDDPAGPVIHNFTSGGTDLTKVSNASLPSSTAPIQGPPSDGYMIASKESRIDFASLLCDSTATTTIHIYNRGAEDVDIGAIGFQRGTIFTAATGGGFPLKGNDSNQTAQILIHVAVTKPGFYSDTLVVSASTICGGIVKIPVTVHKELVAIAFDTSAFDIGRILNCKLPIERQTRLFNKGTTKVTINSLQFSPGPPFTILSPKLPFTIDSGSSIEVKFRIESGGKLQINSTLTATALECPVQAKRTFIGTRVLEQFTVTPGIFFPPIALPTGQIQLDTTVYLVNTGSSDISFNPPLELIGSGGFRITSPVSGLAVVKPDSVLAITIRFTGSECGPYQTLLHLQHIATDGDCGFDFTIPINVTVVGPAIRSLSEFFELGSGCSVRDTTIMFVNTSGREVLLGAPVFSDSAMSLQTFGTLPKLLEDGDSVSLKFRFSPTRPGDYTIYTKMSLSPCGDKLLTFHGYYGVGSIIESDSVVDFNSGCDLSEDIRTILIQNFAGRTVTVNDTSLIGSPHFTIRSPKLPFTMSPGASQEVTVQFKPTSLGVERADITLTENGCYVATIKAKAVREKAQISSTQPVIEFGVNCPLDTGKFILQLKNTGFGEVQLRTVMFHGASVFDTLGNAIGSIPGGFSKSIPFVFLAKDTGEFTGWVELVFGPCNDTLRYVLHGIGGPNPALIASENLIDFGSVKIGQENTVCLKLSNPSCLPIPITLSSLGAVSSGITYTAATLTSLPDSITAEHPVTICYTFKPVQPGDVSIVDTISCGDYGVAIELKGKGVRSVLSVKPSIIDFGDVLVNTTSDSAAIYITNSGDAAASIGVIQPTTDFSIAQTIAQVATSSTDSILVAFTPKTIGVQQSTLIVNSDYQSDTVILRARGTGPGPLFSISSLTFGSVRVGTDSQLTINVSAPKDSQINITDVLISPPFTITPTGPATISANGSKPYTITYHPTAEQFDSVELKIVSVGATDATLPVTGLGVDAHLTITPDSLGFGDVAIHSVGSTKQITISNTGGYPLRLLTKKLQSGVFSLVTDPLVNPIAPHSSVPFDITFVPARGQSYRDSLFITADAVEKNADVVLTGKGVFAPLGIPQVSYTLPAIRARVGDIVPIPVEISGPDLPLIDIDSFYFDLRFDPLVVFFHDTIITIGTLSDGCLLVPNRLSDSVIRITGKGKRLAPVAGVLCILSGEALLGPRDSSALIIDKSNPSNSEPLQSSAGSFLVTDCGNYSGGVLFKGNYSLPPPTPNPVSDIITIPYELGLAAGVKIDLYDQMGRHVKTLLDAARGVGKHELTVRLGDLPSGEYYYVMESLEYRASEKVVLRK